MQQDRALVQNHINVITQLWLEVKSQIKKHFMHKHNKTAVLGFDLTTYGTRVSMLDP